MNKANIGQTYVDDLSYLGYQVVDTYICSMYPYVITACRSQICIDHSSSYSPEPESSSSSSSWVGPRLEGRRGSELRGASCPSSSPSTLLAPSDPAARTGTGSTPRLLPSFPSKSSRSSLCS